MKEHERKKQQDQHLKQVSRNFVHAIKQEVPLHHPSNNDVGFAEVNI
jgi:hypothetical protein